MILNNNINTIKKINLDTKIYEFPFFNAVDIEGDGNCFYICISYHLFGDQEVHKTVRETVYQYIKNNTVFAYD